MAPASCGLPNQSILTKGQRDDGVQKQAYGEHYTHEVVPFAEVVLVRGSKADASWSARRKTLAQGRRGVHQGCLGWWKRDVRSCVLANNSTIGTVSSTRCCTSRHGEGSTVRRTGWCCTRSTEKGTCTTTTTTRFGWREHSESQS